MSAWGPTNSKVDFIWAGIKKFPPLKVNKSTAQMQIAFD